MNRFKVVHAEAAPDTSLPIERAALAAIGADLVCAGTDVPAQLIAAACDADVILSESMSFPGQLLAALPRCRAVVGYTIGLDHYDLRAATELGIVIAHAPGFCADEVSNHALLFILACARRLPLLDRRIRSGWWPDGRNLEGELLPMGSLRGERLGLVSFGAIARLVAGKAQAFGLDVCAFDPLVSADVFARTGVISVALDELLSTSDYVSIHTPLLPTTRHLIGEAQLRRMKPSAFLINTSRGAVVDEAALTRALQEQWIAGAALDVFETEPLAADHPLLGFKNVILTPHVGYCSNAAYDRVRQMVADEAVRILRGEWPQALANPEVRGRARLERVVG